MRKISAIILALMLITTSFTTVFASSANIAPEDVVNTPYEEAVGKLMEKGYISGYPDGTFLPEKEISRAEACSIIVNALQASAADLAGAKNSGFQDLSGYSWAEKYINYAAEKGIVNGYGDGTFKPGENVTYNEFAAMLINALGEEGGNSLNDYFNKAVELKLFDGVTASVTTFAQGGANATRGDVAIMAYGVVDRLEAAGSPDEEESGDTDENGSSGEQGEESSGEEEKDNESSGSSSNNGNETSDALSDYTGRIYGMILDSAKTVNKNGETVDQVKFLFGSQTLYLNTNGSVKLPDKSDYLSGNLYCLRLTNGVIRGVADNGTELGSKSYKEFTGDGYAEVIERSSRYVTVDYKNETGFNVIEDASIYIIDCDRDGVSGYKTGSIRDIEAGAYIRAFDISDKNSGVADAVIVLQKADIDKSGLI